MASFIGSGISYLQLHCDPDDWDSGSDTSVTDDGSDIDDSDYLLTLDDIGFSWGPLGGLVIHSDHNAAKPIFKNKMPLGIKFGTLGENECGICLSDLSPTECATLGCQHSYCRDCLAYYLNQQSGDKNNIHHRTSTLETNENGQHFLRLKEIYGVVCPNPKCYHIIEGAEFRELADKKTWERFNELSFSIHIKHLARMGDIASCSGTCPGYIQDCICTEENCPNLSKYRRIQGSLLNHRWAVGSGIAVCPKCKNMVERNGGCNHMTCRCSAHFMYSENRYEKYVHDGPRALKRIRG